MPCRAKPKHRDNTWGDKNRRQSCRLCNVQGLRFGSKTGLCVDCYSGLPQLVKAGARDEFDLERVMLRYIREMVVTFGVEQAAERMGVPVPWLEGGAGIASLIAPDDRPEPGS